MELTHDVSFMHACEESILHQVAPNVCDSPREADELECMTRVGRGSTVRQSSATRSLNIGILASEFPPDHGGMQEHARGLITSLAGEHKLTVYTSQDFGLGEPVLEDPALDVTVHPVMRWSVSQDFEILERAGVDAWITLNAGLASYSLELSAPVFAYVHGNDFTRPWLPHPERPVRLARQLWGESVVRQWRARRIGAGFRASRWMFANSEFSRSLCARLYDVPAERISVVPPGMRPEFFCNADPGVSSRLRLVTVSRLAASAERKNIDGVIEAVALLKHEIPISYTVIGDGDDLPRLRALVSSLGIEDSVHFLGAVDTPRIIQQFSSSDVFIMAVRPNEGDVEGFGMVYAEAAATGLPSIGANIGGIPEVVEDGVTGLLLDDVSSSGIAAGLRQFHRRRAEFNRDVIRMRAERFSAAHCSAMISQTITSMV